MDENRGRRLGWMQFFLKKAARLPPRVAGTAFFLIAVVVAYLDHITGPEVGLAVFFILPVLGSAWFLGLRGGLMMAVSCTVLWAMADINQERAYSFFFVPYVNAVIRGSYFVIMTILTVKLKRVLNLRSEMVSLVSHEFGNSMTTLGLGLMLLRDEEVARDPVRAARVYEMLTRNQSHIKHTVANFLNLARMESGRYAMDMRRVELRSVVAETLEAMGLLVQEKSIRLRTDFPPEIIPVQADPNAMSLVLANLVGNAVKYSPQGAEVVVRMAIDEANPSQVVVSVADQGLGISREDQARILEGFFRTQEGMAAGKGYGVGLKVTRDILESHGARLEVQSAPGQGSKFSFNLSIA